MIVYELACAREHRFEGWFASADDYASQRERSLVRCPMCDDDAIERRPSANVQVGRAAEPVRRSSEQAGASATEGSGGSATGAGATAAGAPAIPGELLRILRAVVANSDDVGPAFAEEARKIHYEEAPARSIRGQASAEEAAELREEGIDFAALPDFLARNLQ